MTNKKYQKNRLGTLNQISLDQKRKDINTERQKDRETERQKDRKKDRKTEKQRDKKTNLNKYIELFYFSSDSDRFIKSIHL